MLRSLYQPGQRSTDQNNTNDVTTNASKKLKQKDTDPEIEATTHEDESIEQTTENVIETHSDHDSNDETDLSDVNVDFTFHSPVELDFHGIKRLLGQLFADFPTDINFSSLADLILEQPGIGSVVKTDDDTSLDPYAIVTYLPFHLYQTNDGLATVKKFFEKHVSVSNKIGWLISERVLNLPPQLAAPMLRMLCEDIQRAVSLGEDFKSSEMIYVSKQYKLIESTTKCSNSVSNDEELEMYQPEDIVFQQHASKKVIVPWKRKRSGDASCVFDEDGFTLKEYRVLYIIAYDKLPQLVDALEKFLA